MTESAGWLGEQRPALSGETCKADVIDAKPVGGRIQTRTVFLLGHYTGASLAPSSFLKIVQTNVGGCPHVTLLEREPEHMLGKKGWGHNVPVPCLWWLCERTELTLGMLCPWTINLVSLSPAGSLTQKGPRGRQGVRTWSAPWSPGCCSSWRSLFCLLYPLSSFSPFRVSSNAVSSLETSMTLWAE